MIIVKVSVIKYLWCIYLMLAIVCFPQKNTEDEIREHVLNCLIHLQSQVKAVTTFLFLCF